MDFRFKVILSGILVSALVLIIVSVTMMKSLRSEVLNHAESRLNIEALSRNHNLSEIFSEKAIVLSQSARLVGNLLSMEAGQRDSEILDYLRLVTIENPEFINISVFYDNADGYSESEMVRYNYFNEGGSLLVHSDTIVKSDLSHDHPHLRVKLNKGDALSKVFISDVWGDNIPTVTYSIPINYRGNFIGSINADISLHEFSDILGTSILISETDQIIYHPDNRYNSLTLNEAPLEEKVKELIQKTKVNERSLAWDYFNYSALIIDGLSIGNTNKYWRIVSNYSFKEIYSVYESELNRIFLFIVLGLLLLGYVLYYFTSGIYNSLKTVSMFATELSSGHIDPDEIKNTKVKNQEASIVLDSLEVLARDIKTKADFTVSLEEGDLEKDFDCSSDDKLGSALLSLRSNLKSARIEAEKRQWTNEGLTKFSAILRDHSNNFEKLCTLLISELVRYMGTNQGSIFLLKEEEDESEKDRLQLISTYAYDRKKFIKKEVSVEDGLIGQSFQEKATIHLTEIPEDYISITSGLGQAVPKVLLIVPLKVELEVNGIIEMAGFRPFKNYEIDFIEKLAESISLTIKNSQTNEATRKLLRQSQIQAEELKSAEEEMRQNMEELQTTQEELNRRAKETETLLKNTERKGELSNLQIEISNLLSNANSTDQVYQTVIKEIGEKLNFKFACGYATGLARGKRVFNSLKTIYSRNENLHQSYINTVLDSVIPITQDLLGVVYESKEAKFFDNFSELEIFTRREEALNAKLYSVYLFPIAIGKKVSGILEFYSDNGLPEDPNITEFGIQMGQQLGEILSRVKMSEATMVNEEAMAKWQFDMRAIVDGLPVSMIVIDENGKVENNNKNYITMMNLNILTVAKESFYSYVGDKTIKFESGNTYKTTLTPVGGEPINVSIKVQEIKKNEGMRNLLLIDKLE